MQAGAVRQGAIASRTAKAVQACRNVAQYRHDRVALRHRLTAISSGGAHRAMASFFKRLRCVFGRHSPARKRVHYENDHKVGPCRYCGARLEKGRDGRWQERRKD